MKIYEAAQSPVDKCSIFMILRSCRKPQETNNQITDSNFTPQVQTGISSKGFTVNDASGPESFLDCGKSQLWTLC